MNNFDFLAIKSFKKIRKITKRSFCLNAISLKSCGAKNRLTKLTRPIYPRRHLKYTRLTLTLERRLDDVVGSGTGSRMNG